MMSKPKTYIAHRPVMGRFSLGRFARDERGSPAVEFALIMSLVLVPLLLGIIQFGFAFYTYNEMMNGAREGARRMAVGESFVEAKQSALATMVFADDHNYTFKEPEHDSDSVAMEITLPISGTLMGQILPLPMPDVNLSASVTMRKEY